MKTMFILALSIVLLSCSDPSAPSSTTDHGSTGSALNKVDPPPVTSIHLRLSEYNRNSQNEWCVEFRVFADNGAALPATGNYVWEMDWDAYDGVDNWVTASWSSPGNKSKKMDGCSDPEDNSSRFKIRAYYNGMLTDTWIVGADMRGQPITGCTHDPDNDPDSRFSSVQ